MAKQSTKIQNNFTGGEMSPLMDARQDIGKYNNGCQTLQNFLVYPQGGAFKRPGFQFIAEVPDRNNFTRLIPFEFSDTDSYVLEFSDLLIRFYRTTSAGSGLVLDDDEATPTSIASPYGASTTAALSETPDIQHVQTGDVMYLVHPSYKPRRLVRTDNNSWTISAPEFLRGPFLRENDTDTTMKVQTYTIDAVTTGLGGTFTIKDDGDLSDIFEDGNKIEVVSSTGNNGIWTIASTSYTAPDFVITVVTGENITDATVDGGMWPDVGPGNNVELILSAASGAESFVGFESTHVGALFQITVNQQSDSVDGSLASAGPDANYVQLALGQSFDFFTTGLWTGTMALEVSYDEGTSWETVYTAAFENNGNITELITDEVGGGRYRANMTAYTSGSCEFNITSRPIPIKGVVEIDTVNNTTSAIGEIKSQIAKPVGVPTKRWSEGSWSDKRGWPSTVTFFEQRLFFANTAYQPTTTWSSISFPGGDYQNFLAGSLDDSALVFTLADAEQNPTKWMVSDRQLIIGTSAGESTLGASSTTDPLTPTNFKVSSHESNKGSENIQPSRTAVGHLFVERGGRKVNELVFNWEADGFVAIDMNRLADHITEGGITEAGMQKRPEPILWCITGDGVLIGLTYLREEGIVAWHRQVLGGNGLAESKAIISGRVSEDELWIVIKITIKGLQKRYVCRMKEWATVNGSGDQEDAFLVDYGLTYDSTATTTITGLGHLEGELVSILGDGSERPRKTVKDSQITLDESASVAQVGLAYTATLKPMKIPSDKLKNLRVSHAVPTFYNTGYCEIGTTQGNLKPIEFPNKKFDVPRPLFTGVLSPDTLPGGFNKAGDIILQSDKPLPLTILSLTSLIESN